MSIFMKIERFFENFKCDIGLSKRRKKGLHFLRDLTVLVTPNIDSAEQRKRADTVSDYQPFEGTREFAVNILLHLYFVCLGRALWCHCPVVDANVVDQAGEETAGFKILSGTQI